MSEFNKKEIGGLGDDNDMHHEGVFSDYVNLKGLLEIAEKRGDEEGAQRAREQLVILEKKLLTLEDTNVRRRLDLEKTRQVVEKDLENIRKVEEKDLVRARRTVENVPMGDSEIIDKALAIDLHDSEKVCDFYQECSIGLGGVVFVEKLRKIAKSSGKINSQQTKQLEAVANAVDMFLSRQVTPRELDSQGVDTVFVKRDSRDGDEGRGQLSAVFKRIKGILTGGR